MLCLLAMITYLDRTTNGIAQKDIMLAVGRDPVDFFWVLTAFQLGYALFEIPTGYLGDRFGPRKTIIRLVIWWSFFMSLNPIIGLAIPHSIQIAGTTIFIAYLLLIGAEFLFGVGEAGAFPNITRALYNWFPATQRGVAQGTIWLSARFMGGFTPLTWVLLVELGGLSWRQAFWLFAAIAGVWCMVFFWWFRNHPHEHSATNEAGRPDRRRPDAARRSPRRALGKDLHQPERAGTLRDVHGDQLQLVLHHVLPAGDVQRTVPDMEPVG